MRERIKSSSVLFGDDALDYSHKGSSETLSTGSWPLGAMKFPWISDCVGTRILSDDPTSSMAPSNLLRLRLGPLHRSILNWSEGDSRSRLCTRLVECWEISTGRNPLRHRVQALCWRHLFHIHQAVSLATSPGCADCRKPALPLLFFKTARTRASSCTCSVSVADLQPSVLSPLLFLARWCYATGRQPANLPCLCRNSDSVS